jgi:tetratricopeptide (TPR) repeat protein
LGIRHPWFPWPWSIPFSFVDGKIISQSIDELESLLMSHCHHKLYAEVVHDCTLLIKLILVLFKLNFDSPVVSFFPPPNSLENKLKTALSLYFNQRGNAYFIIGEKEKAIEDYDWALGMEGLTEPWVTLCNRSLANTNLGRWDEAEKDLLDARRIAPRPIKAVEDLLAQLKKAKPKQNPSIESHDPSTNPLLLLGKRIRKVIKNIFALQSNAKPNGTDPKAGVD